MDPILIAQLLATFGPQAFDLVDGLIKKAEAKGDVTSEEWAVLSKDVRVSSKDLMLAALVQVGIDPASSQGIALLEAAK